MARRHRGVRALINDSDSPKNDAAGQQHCPVGGVVTTPPSNGTMVADGACEIGPLSPEQRAECAREVRRQGAECLYLDERCQQSGSCATPAGNGNGNGEGKGDGDGDGQGSYCDHPCNGDEIFYQQSPTLPDGSPNPYKERYPASFTKGFPHDPQTGLLQDDPTPDAEDGTEAYRRLLFALATGNPDDFENIRPLGCRRCVEEPCLPRPPRRVQPQRLLENPQSGFAFHLEGADPQRLCMPPAPCFASKAEVAELAELYWMALTRDVPFTRYGNDPIIAAAVDDLNSHFRPYLSRHLPPGNLNPQTIFRGPTAGDQVGPHISQFLLLDVPYGAQVIPAAIRTLLPSIDFLTNWDEWLAVQNGCDAEQSNCDPVLRLIRSGRDIAQYVHVDRDYNAFFNACHLLLYGREPLRRCEASPGLGVPFGPCLPYGNSLAPVEEEFPDKSRNQIGQGTFGDQHVKSVLVGATFRAFNAVWFQKWMVHRRLRPEEFGGRVHLEVLRREGDPAGQLFPVNPILFDSTLFTDGLLFAHTALQNANIRQPTRDFLGRPSNDGTYLLPTAYAEGSPLHPSYGSGHSTVSGCLATILKAFFHNDWIFPSPVEANEDGTSLRLYTGPDAGALTVAGELDKLASNIGIGRMWGGVHWRSDHEESLILGEQMAISILCDQRNTFNEPFEFRFRSFDFGPYQGQVVRIRPDTSPWRESKECPRCVETLPRDQYEAGCDRESRRFCQSRDEGK